MNYGDNLRPYIHGMIYIIRFKFWYGTLSTGRWLSWRDCWNYYKENYDYKKHLGE